MLIKSLVICAFSFSLVQGQISVFPYHEGFDNVPAPELPAAWKTTTAKSSAGDFTTTTSTVKSLPNAVVSTDAKVSQSLITPIFDFSEKLAGSLQFYERRSSSYNAGMVVEASVGNDTSFSVMLGDTLTYPGTTDFVLRMLPLPASLDNQPNVRFRWRTLGNGTGSTGTIRLDDIDVSVQKMIDLAITSMQFQPVVPQFGQTVTLNIGIANHAIGGSHSFTLQVFDSLNGESNLVLHQDESYSFAAGESILVSIPYPKIKAGTHILTAKLILPNDENPDDNTFTATLAVAYPGRSVLINEIMYAPVAGPEWVEFISNFSDTLSPEGWKIGDNTSTRAVISQHILIPPHQLFVVAKDSSFFAQYSFVNAPVIISTFPTLNNDFDAVVIADPSGFTTDSVAYNSSWGGTGGRSLERIDTSLSSTSSSNWGSSRDPRGATPGAVNSITPKDFDVAVRQIKISPTFPTVGNPLQATAVIKNVGKQDLQSVTIKFYLDANLDSIIQENELIGQENIASLASGDSTIVQENLPIQNEGMKRIFVVAVCMQDEDSSNNTLSFSFYVGNAPNTVVINEIMYAPPGDMPEWIELYNTNNDSVDISGWKASDEKTSVKSEFHGSGFMIGPHSFCIVAHDSTFLQYFQAETPFFTSTFSALNNSTPDAAVIFDKNGVTMDSVFYKPSWGGSNGTSLQRVDYYGSSSDSTNWKSATPTPGIENSVAKKDFDLSLTSGSSARIGTAIRVSAVVRNVGRSPVSGFSVKFYYDANGDSVAEINELLYTQTVTSIINANDSVLVYFDWNISLRGEASVIVLLEDAQDQRNDNNLLFVNISNNYAPLSVIVNEIMYEPLEGKSEFVEIFNRSADTVNLQNWKIMDAPGAGGTRTSTMLSKNSLPLLPSGYAVLASDSSLLQQFPEMLSSGSRIIISNKDLSLNNDGDDVVLCDQTGLQIDSVRYSPSWHRASIITTGKSLERISPNVSSNDSRNWSTCVSPDGATPGMKNSIFTLVVPSSATMKLTPNPFSPDNDGFNDFLTISYSLPSAVATIRVRCYDINGRLVKTIANNEPAASTGTLIWNGLDDDNQRVRIGMYIILFEALDAKGGTIRTMKDVAVVAAKLR
jgi:Lamin Tail Domain/CARDB